MRTHIESAGYDLQKEYTARYKMPKFKHDSPNDSRTSMVRRIVNVLKETRSLPSKYVLNIGSGPQALEKQLLCQPSLKNREIFERLSFLTTDIATLGSHQLMVKNMRMSITLKATPCVFLIRITAWEW